MGGWYWIGVSVGLGTGAGVLLVGVVTGLLGVTRLAIISSALIAAIGGAAIGNAIDASEPGGWANLVAGLLGGITGTLAAAQIVGGALRRGGTRGGTAAIVAVSGVVLAALALVPILGYIEAIGLPAIAARIRRRLPDKHEGLRTLARD
ncbi:MAG TPA: hypothetical protein VMB53_10725 [Gaiellaceae bacterium]|nr:hypothetical protein [Gaiellaceae bacterium]